MKRSPNLLADKEFDVVIVGGGIFGACAAWDAALRGFSVALVERRDFCSGAISFHNPEWHQWAVVCSGFRCGSTT